MDDEAVRLALLEIEETVRSASFEKWRKQFVAANVNHFTFDDENKLIYTEIHKQYEEEIEKRIRDAFPDTFSQEDFYAALPTYIDGPGKLDNATGRAITLLLEVSDFEQFKTMMMVRRREIEEEESKHSERQLEGVSVARGGEVMAAYDIEGMMDLCASVSRAADDEAGWVNLLTLDWMKIDKKPVEAPRANKKNDIYLRGVWTMNLSFEECCDMMFTLGPRRSGWDTNFAGVVFPQGGSDADDDVVTSASLNFGYLVNLVMFGSGSGTVLTSRNIRKWDTPSAHSVTYAMVPWNLEANEMDRNHKLLSLKTGTICPHPTLADKCVMTTLEVNTMGGMPNWALHFMMKATAPSMMRALESRYIANVRNHNSVVNTTPYGRRGEEKEDFYHESKSHK